MKAQAHVMLIPPAYCPHCGDAMLYLNRFLPPDFTADAFCGRCDYTVKLTAKTWTGERA